MHHFTDLFIVPLPRTLHRICGCNDVYWHRAKCEPWLELFYGFNPRELFYGTNDNHVFDDIADGSLDPNYDILDDQIVMKSVIDLYMQLGLASMIGLLDDYYDNLPVIPHHRD